MTTDSSWAAIVLAHAEPEHLHRLVSALAGVPIVLHIDAKTSDAVHRQMLAGLPHDVVLAPRIDTRLASWSLVDAELSALRLALHSTAARHFAILSGADFPLAAPEAIAGTLTALNDESWISNRRLPFERWNAPGFSDGGLWRLRHYFPTKHDHIRWLRGRPVFIPVRRKIPDEIVPSMNAQWKIYSRRDAERLLDTLAKRPYLTEFGRHTFTPEESFVSSVLASDKIFGDAALKPQLENAWFVNWPREKVTHPGYFAMDDLARLQSAADGNVSPVGIQSAHEVQQRAPLFARKFRSSSGDLADALRSKW